VAGREITRRGIIVSHGRTMASFIARVTRVVDREPIAFPANPPAGLPYCIYRVRFERGDSGNRVAIFEVFPPE